MVECSRFLAMVPGERWEIVKEQRGCFSCLRRGKGHTSFNCVRRKACGTKRRDGTVCKRPHHELLHEGDNSEALHVTFVQDNSKAILPVISSFMKGREGEVNQTNVFCQHDSECVCRPIRTGHTASLSRS